MNKKNKAIIFAPHQDDEINIAGGLISTLLENNIEVRVVYSTNGDYCTKASTRIKECKKALNTLGLDEKDIYFMGYSDQTRVEDTHLYMTDASNIWKSKKKFTKTYHPFNDKEIAMIYDKKHHDFNKYNFQEDIISILKDYKPDYIYCIDFDSHPDHRALSLSVEYAIGKIINEIKDYRPTVYKAFAYPTFYYGYNDLDDINIKSTTFNTEKYSYCNMENPYYVWDKRIRFPLSQKTHNKFLLNNLVYKALRCHKSQCIVGRAFSTINGDQIYFQRRTDNLLNNSELEVSSGDMEKLRDFMLFDCKNIMHGDSEKVVLESNAWVPDKNDRQPEINIRFDEMKEISEIIFYHSISSDEIISKIEILADNKYSKKYTLSREAGNISTIKLDNLSTKEIKIRVLSKYNYAGFSEIEIFESCDNLIKYIKTEINDDFAYKYYYNNEKFQIYSYNGINSRYLCPDEYNISSNVTIKDNRFIINNKKEKVRVSLKCNPDIYDEITLVKKDFISKLNNKIVNIINKIAVGICYSKQKIIRKIKRLIKIN